jgi:hypothetical protein
MTTYPENFTVSTTERARISLPVIHAQNLEFQGSIEMFVAASSLLFPLSPS